MVAEVGEWDGLAAAGAFYGWEGLVGHVKGTCVVGYRISCGCGLGVVGDRNEIVCSDYRQS